MDLTTENGVFKEERHYTAAEMYTIAVCSRPKQLSLLAVMRRTTVAGGLALENEQSSACGAAIVKTVSAPIRHPLVYWASKSSLNRYRSWRFSLFDLLSECANDGGS